MGKTFILEECGKAIATHAFYFYLAQSQTHATDASLDSTCDQYFNYFFTYYHFQDSFLVLCTFSRALRTSNCSHYVKSLLSVQNTHCIYVLYVICYVCNIHGLFFLFVNTLISICRNYDIVKSPMAFS